MDMWNWLHDLYNDGHLTIDDMEKILNDETAAMDLWIEWTANSHDFIDYVKSEVQFFLCYVKQKEKEKNEKWIWSDLFFHLRRKNSQDIRTKKIYWNTKKLLESWNNTNLVSGDYGINFNYVTHYIVIEIN